MPFAAKLSPPSPSIPLVERPRLVDELLAFTGRVVVLSAPAGYGKSILAAQWLAADPRPGAWLSLDASDNDPHVLLTYLALAAGQADHGLDTDADLDEVLSLLTRLLATRAAPGLLVLDDAHLIEGDGPSAAVLTTIAMHVPPGSTLAVLTREPPSIPTARGVLQGTARVIDADELAMTIDEAGALLTESGISDPGDAVAALVDATEGWPAGLYLASLALRDTDDPSATARSISGRQRLITDFFVEEVLPSIAPGDLAFLLDTAILDRCSADLCDAVLDRTDSGATLERLARTNRFVIPLDDDGRWYRYHHLFAEMLQAEARRRDAAGVARVARAASVWWEARFEPDEAVALALATSDHERAVELIARWAPVLQNDRRHVTVSRWLGAFGDEQTMATPGLALAAAWNALLIGDATSVHRFTAAVEQSDAETLPDGSSTHAAAELLRALTTSDGLTAVGVHARVAFDTHPENSPFRAVAAHLVSSSRLMLGDLDGAVAFIDDAIALGRSHLQPIQAHAVANRARLAVMLDDLPDARRSADDAVAVAETHWLTERPALGIVYSAAALICAQTGATITADEYRAHALALVARLDDVLPFHTAVALLECAESAVVCGRVDEATELLAEAERRLRRLRDTGLLPFALDRVGAAIARASARPPASLVEPLSPAELRVLAYLPTHLSFGEIGEELFVSRNTVKSHAMAIYRKLGVTSRSAAVKEAGNLGLIAS